MRLKLLDGAGQNVKRPLHVRVDDVWRLHERDRPDASCAPTRH
jgi:hypothetical protein